MRRMRRMWRGQLGPPRFPPPLQQKHMQPWGAWDAHPVSECSQQTGKTPIGGRWVVHNTGDAASPNAR
eukprot:13788057-Alexandrium_andersonii.AAC.1